MFSSIKKFLGPVHGAVQGEIKTEEVKRSGILSVVSASTIWVILSFLWAFIQYVISDPNFLVSLQSLIELAKDRNYVAILIAILTFLVDFLRRRSQGKVK